MVSVVACPFAWAWPLAAGLEMSTSAPVALAAVTVAVAAASVSVSASASASAAVSTSFTSGPPGSAPGLSSAVSCGGGFEVLCVPRVSECASRGACGPGNGKRKRDGKNLGSLSYPSDLGRVTGPHIPDRDSLALLTLPQQRRPQRHRSLCRRWCWAQAVSAARERRRCSCRWRCFSSSCCPSSCCWRRLRHLLVTARHHFPLAQMQAGEAGREGNQGGDVRVCVWPGLARPGHWHQQPVHAPQAHPGTYLGLLIGRNLWARQKKTWCRLQLAVLVLASWWLGTRRRGREDGRYVACKAIRLVSTLGCGSTTDGQVPPAPTPTPQSSFSSSVIIHVDSCSRELV